MEKLTSKTKGLIYNIQRYSLHDGPGIRTIVFLKGCPLHCPWCANPESQSPKMEMMGEYNVGNMVTVEEVLKTVSRDKVFYKGSSGGMTLSGGEPLMQPDFAAALVSEAQKNDIHVAIETTGLQKWHLFWKVIKNVDLILLDIKIMNPQHHKEVIGVSNKLILQNAQKIRDMNKKVIIRVPIIPGYNDNLDNLMNTAIFSKKIGAEEIHFLPYHRLGEYKYKKLGRKYMLEGVDVPEKEKIKEIAMKIQNKYGISILVI